MNKNSFQEALKFFKVGKYADAERTLLSCLGEKQFTFQIFGLLGYVYGNQGKYHDSIFYLNKALELEPKNGEIIYHLAIAQFYLGIYEEAIKNLLFLNQLIGEKYEVNLKLAQIYEKSGKLVDSLQCYKNLLKFKTNENSTTYEIINLLIKLKRYKEAINLYDHLIPGGDVPSTIVGEKIYLEMMICDWSNFQKVQTETNSQNWIEKFTPNHLLSLPITSEKQKLLTEFYVDRNFRGSNFKINARANKKIRLGYFSSDFHNHATAYLLAEFFELQDKNYFEIFAISYGPDVDDFYRKRLKKSFDGFYQVDQQSQAELTKFSRDLMLDVAIDLKGHGKNSAIKLFSERIAPIQINYLVYPGTTGATFMDYIIADSIVIPYGDEKYYSEKVIRMKSCYQVSDRQRLISNSVLTKEACGLPSNAIIFACFNNNYKITPAIFDVWMRVLKKIPDGILWLLEDNSEAKKNLIKEALQRGVPKEKIKFAQRSATPDHLARHVHIDLFLDTAFYNAHTTANDALWMGVPIVTLYGDTFASRVCSSLLNDLEMNDLITYSLEEYENKIIDLAINPEKLRDLKNRLAQKKTGKLFDTTSKVRDFEEIIKNLVHEHRVNPISQIH